MGMHGFLLPAILFSVFRGGRNRFAGFLFLPIFFLCSAPVLGQGADLRRANLQNARLSVANLKGADLRGADLRAALYETNLQGVNLWRVNLNGANLNWANLEEAGLWMAKGLGSESYLGANLKGADFSGVDLTEHRYEPRPGGVPAVESLSETKNLETLWYKKSPTALVELRKAFKEAGYCEHERQITYAIKRSEWKKKWTETKDEEGK